LLCCCASSCNVATMGKVVGLLFQFAIAVVVVISYTQCAHHNDGEKTSEDIFQSFWHWRMLNAPEFATFVGNFKYDMYLDDMSLDSYAARAYDVSVILGDAKNKSRTSTPDLELLITELEQFLIGQKFKSYVWPMNNLEGPHLDFPRLLGWMKRNNKNDIMKILARMRQFSQQMDEQIILMKEGLRDGLVMHNVSINNLPSVMKGMASEPAVKSPVFKPFTGKKPKKISKQLWKKFVAIAKKLVKTKIQPAYLKMATFLEEEYIPHTRTDVGMSSLPNGHAFYAACLKYHTTTDYTPQHIHELGLQEVARINKRFEEVKEKVGFNGTLADFRNHMLTDPKFNYSNGDEIVKNYQEKGKTIHALLHNIFAVLPNTSYVIEPIAPEVAPMFPGAFYLAPSADGSRPGTFFINTYKPETRKRYEAVALSLHEAEPGHHLQGALTIEHGSQYKFRRFMEDRKYYEAPLSFAKNTAYVEGWGLYAEYLGEELGLYKDHYDMAGRLSHEMFRACRLVVDTGMHALGMSREAAVQFMHDNTALAMHDIESEVNRYITWPGQACAYKIGEIKLKALRAKATEALGEKFDLKDYHVFIAAMGGVPLDFLERQVDKYIEEHK